MIHVITTEKKFYTSRYDKVFKTVFAEPVEVLEFLSVEQPLEKITDKRKVLDCLVKVSDKYVNVEINLNDYDTAKAVRNFAYLCSFYNQNTRKGDAYDTETLCVQVKGINTVIY